MIEISTAFNPLPQQSNAGQALLDAMHDFYESLQANEMRLFRAFAESDLKFTE